MNKRLRPLYIIALYSMLTSSFAINNVPSATRSDAANQTKVIPLDIPPLLRARIESDIIQVYGPQNAGEIFAQVSKVISTTKANRPRSFRKKDVTDSPIWYKKGITYMFYAENFGTDGKKTNNFKSLIKMVPYLKNLGVTNVYILPYLDSPMKDSGFDVKDPMATRPDLGSVPDFKRFTDMLHKNGITVTGDLVLNHLSDQNRWFQQAIKGDKEKLNYFVYKDYLPKSSKYYDAVRGVVVDYTNKDGSVSSRRLIFPEQTPDHYRHEVIAGKDYYFYHTFYPFQIDLNWKNPQLLYKMLEVVGFWCNQGIDIFRLDAIPFLIKDDGATGENSPKTHALVNLLSSFLQTSCPKSVLQAEAGQSPEDILLYFGKQESYTYTDLNKSIGINRTDEVQIAYNFLLMHSLWASMLLGNNKYFWDIYNSIPVIPKTNTWTNFLRIHDELSLENATPEMRKILYAALVKKGAPFREGLGVSGRMANFLDKDTRRINQAFAILMSLPDVPIIYYGDEIGALNNWRYAKAKELSRKKNSSLKDKSSEKSHFDSRDINRGPISYGSFQTAIKNPQSYSGKIYTSVQHDIILRKATHALEQGDIKRITSNSSQIFAYLRTLPDSIVLVINNLSDSKLNPTLDFPLAGINSGYLDLRSNKNILLKNVGKGSSLILYPYQTVWLKIK
ncbi:MAG: Trehalose synthase [Burkholderiales bacterium]|jgi:maltose alpha-D-glucosyltransferase/alpha-amylase|nr:Trehalose synthase [Burkholderiales bacterium]